MQFNSTEYHEGPESGWVVGAENTKRHSALSFIEAVPERCRKHLHDSLPFRQHELMEFWKHREAMIISG